MNSDTTKKDRAWLLPDCRKEQIKGGLYLVSTPIGNLADISVRGLDVLSLADLVVCEDTRVTKKLLSYYGLEAPLLSYNDHNAEGRRGQILDGLSQGQVIAFVSDAGTPLVSDPGFKLVRDCLDLGLPVTSVPGASAVLSGLQLSGLPSDRFSFLGFLPSKKGARTTTLEAWRGVPGSLIAFESGMRLVAALESVRDVLGERDVAVVREITKMYEESRRGRTSELIQFYEQEGAPKGEIVLVVGPGETDVLSEKDIKAQLVDALKTMSTKEAAAHVASVTGLSRKTLYELALKVSKA